MVASVDVGALRDRLFVSLSFISNDVFFHRPGTCPVFVKCLDVLSESYHFVDETIEMNALFYTGDAASELFSFGGMPPVRLDFVIGQSKKLWDLKELDVAGSIGLGHGSVFTRRKILFLHASVPTRLVPGGESDFVVPVWTMSYLSNIPADLTNLIRISAKIQSDSVLWSFKVSIGGSFVTASFAPEVSDIVVGDWSLVGESISTNSMRHRFVKNRLYVACSALRSMRRLRLDFGSRYLFIYPEQLRFYGIENQKMAIWDSGGALCPTRLVQGESWQLGLPLLASLDSVVLDGIRNKIHFQIAKSRAQRIFSPTASAGLLPLHKVYRFSPTPTISQTEASLVIDFGPPVSIEDSVLLVTPHVVHLQTSGLLMAMKGRKLDRPAKGSTPVPGLYHFIGDELSFVGDLVHFVVHLVPAYDLNKSCYAVRIIDTGFGVFVAFDKRSVHIVTDSFAIAPPSQLAIKTDTHCCICMDEYELGDSVQSLAPACMHTFHYACIEPWIGKRPTCPICRASVPFKHGATFGRLCIDTPA